MYKTTVDLGVIRRPTIFDVDYLCENAREADKKEAYLLSGRSLRESFEDTPGLYENSFVWEMNGKLVCMYGVTPWKDDENVIWFLATDEFDKYKNIVRRHSKRVFEELIKGKKNLFNYVHAEHPTALKWLEWLGCDIHIAEPIGLGGAMFCKFEVNHV